MIEYMLCLKRTRMESSFADVAIESVLRIRDCKAPGIIVAAVFPGHRYARELDGNQPEMLLSTRGLNCVQCNFTVSTSFSITARTDSSS